MSTSMVILTIILSNGQLTLHNVPDMATCVALRDTIANAYIRERLPAGQVVFSNCKQAV